MADPRRSRTLANPQPGWFKTRLVKGGVHVPARIMRLCPMVLPTVTVLQGGIIYPDLEPGEPHPVDWCRPLDRGLRPLIAEINGEPANVDDVWTVADITTAAEFHYLTAMGAYAREHDPTLPQATPRRAVDLRQQPSLF